MLGRSAPYNVSGFVEERIERVILPGCMVGQARQTVHDLRPGLQQRAELRRIVLEPLMHRLVDECQRLLELQMGIEEA